MKVRPSVKKICEKCKIIRRHGNVMVICCLCRGFSQMTITLPWRRMILHFSQILDRKSVV